jgi:hypothetical protein
MAKKKKKNNEGSIVLLLLGVAVGGFALFSSSGKDQETNESTPGSSGPAGSSSLPRGIANNNPLNLIITGIDWQGKVPKKDNTDGKFEQFYDPALGYRAGIKNMRYYVENENRDTLRTIIERWNEGPDENYIKYVSDRTGIGATAKIPKDWFYNTTKLWDIVRAMAEFENGPQNASLVKYSEYYKGFNLA